MDQFAILGPLSGLFAMVSLGPVESQPNTRTLELVYAAVALGFAAHGGLSFQLKARRASRG